MAGMSTRSCEPAPQGCNAATRWRNLLILLALSVAEIVRPALRV